MTNPGLQRHIVKANFIWDLPNWTAAGSARIAAALVNDWQLSGIFTGGSGARYDIAYQYQNDGANVNLTGSPDYAARVVINGDPDSGCSGDRFRPEGGKAEGTPTIAPSGIAVYTGSKYPGWKNSPVRCRARRIAGAPSGDQRTKHYAPGSRIPAVRPRSRRDHRA